MAAALVFVKHPVDRGERSAGDYALLRDAYVNGYMSVRDLPSDWEHTLPIYLATRLFTMLDWMTYHWPCIDYLPWGPSAVTATVDALQPYAGDKPVGLTKCR